MAWDIKACSGMLLTFWVLVICIYSLFKNNHCPGYTYILIWGLLYKYILIKIIPKNIPFNPFKNTTNYY